MKKYFYYDIKDGVKVVALISDKKVDNLGDNYVVAEDIPLEEDSDLLINDANEPFYRPRKGSVRELKKENEKIKKALEIMLGEE